MKVKFIVSILSFLVTGCATSLSGVVVDEVNSENSFKDASANLTTLDSNKINSFVTSIDSSGEFKFDVDLEKGKYLLEILAPGYKLFSTEIYIDTSKNVQYTLTPIKNSKISPLSVNTELDSSKGIGETYLTPPKL